MTMPLSFATVVVLAVLVNVAVPPGTLFGLQLSGSVHSFGLPALPPTHWASWARTIAGAAPNATANAADATQRISARCREAPTRSLCRNRPRDEFRFSVGEVSTFDVVELNQSQRMLPRGHIRSEQCPV